MSDHLDDSPDASELDLSPRSAPTDAPVAPRRRRNWGVAAVLGVLLAVAAFVVFQGLSQATVFFCNADEVGRRDDCSGDGRFRLQGTVDDGTLLRTDDGLDFTVSFNGATVPVRYVGAEPSDMFTEGIPVVVEGRLDTAGDTFDGDRILVKHSEQYREKNPERLPEDAP